ncbi:hypothetical protein IC575_014952 [Cucumis melo]
MPKLSSSCCWSKSSSGAPLFSQARQTLQKLADTCSSPMVGFEDVEGVDGGKCSSLWLLLEIEVDSGSRN